jgi:hypothetical protein
MTTFKKKSILTIHQDGVFGPYSKSIFSTENSFCILYELFDGDGLKYPIEPIPGKNYYSDINFQNNLFNYFGKLDVQCSSPCVNIYGEDCSVMVEGTE